VRDTGIGMNEDQKMNILKAFVSFQNNTIDYVNTRGFGMGLTITARLIYGLSDNRKINIESNLGEGSIFQFYVKNHS
jgi:signal transduction histidine kinase